MTTQLDFLSPAPPAQRHSPTSVDAAEQIESSAETMRSKVRDYLRACGSNGATDEEIQTALGMNPSTQRPRRIELQQLGLVCSAGFVRKTISGRSATVWKAA
jgi:hypothetical protein